MTTKGPETFHHRQIQKLHRFLSPNSGGLKLNLMLATLPSIRGSGIDFGKLTSKNSNMESIAQVSDFLNSTWTRVFVFLRNFVIGTS